VRERQGEGASAREVKVGEEVEVGGGEDSLREREIQRERVCVWGRWGGGGGGGKTLGRCDGGK